MIEIYISNKKLDLIEDIDVNFTYTSIDTMNPSAVKNSFSKTVSVPSTPNNDEIFGHIWRFDSYITSSNPTNYTGVYFDPHKRTPFYIMRNGAVVENGYCVLESISMRENEKTYNLNLFGGLGEFFFNLMYDEDGKEKNLTDLYWKWIPMLSYDSLDWEDDPLTPEEEESSVLYRLNSSNVCASWPLFDPNDNLAYDSKSFICSDIMFVPMYYGYNHDFISNKILVNDYQRTNSGSSTIQTQWNKYLPVQYQEDDETYTLYEEDTDNKYGIIETPRDLDPTEARDFRVTNMPIAIRLSKLMNRISDPDNNGGYTVVWDSKIKSSYWWKYGFILTDTPEYDLGQQSYGELEFTSQTLSQRRTLPSKSFTEQRQETVSSNFDTSILSDPKLSIHIDTELSTIMNQTNIYSDLDQVACLGGHVKEIDTPYTTFMKSSNLLCYIIDIYDGTTFVKNELYVVCFSNTDDSFGTGYTISNIGDIAYPSISNNAKTKILTYINNRFSTSFTDYVMFDGINLTRTGEASTTTPIKYNGSIDLSIDLPTNISNLTVKITNFDLTYIYKGTRQTYATTLTVDDRVYGKTAQDVQDIINWVVETFGPTETGGNPNLDADTYLFFLNYKDMSGNPYWFYKNLGKVTHYAIPGVPSGGVRIESNLDITSKYNVNIVNGDILQGTYLNIYKDTLLNNTSSPYKYLIDFAKMLNLRFLYNKHEKKITIMPHNRYWINKTIDINNKVDVGREINVKHLFDKTKFIKLNLDTPDTWAETIYKKLSKYEYGEYIKDTGIQFNKESKNLLDNLTYSNSMLWQNKSIYYDGNNIGRYFLPTPTNQNIFDWTLFKVDGDETKSLTRSQSGSNCIDTIDELPKIGSFDKDNKSVKVGTTFVFYNGLVKNFTLSDAQISSSLITLTPDSINESHYIPASGGTGSTQYQDIYIYNVEPDTTYYVTASNSSSYTSYIVNYYNANGVRIGTEYSQANANLSDAVLTLPSGTTQIRCNFRKADTNAKLKGLSSNSYVLSPYFTVSDNTRIQQQLAGGYCYYYGFKSDGVGFGTGAACTACSASWYVPYFSRDLYNTYKSSTSTWKQEETLQASWDLVQPEAILYNETKLEFITDRNISYSFPNMITAPTNFASFNTYTKSKGSYIVGNFWNDYISDFYDRNSKEITCYCKIDEEPETALRKFYSFRGSLWIMTKIENYKLNFYEDNFSKVTLHKVRNKNNYLWKEKLTPSQQQAIVDQNQAEE